MWKKYLSTLVCGDNNARIIEAIPLIHTFHIGVSTQIMWKTFQQKSSLWIMWISKVFILVQPHPTMENKTSIYRSFFTFHHLSTSVDK